MSDLRSKINEVAELMSEFGLEQAKLKGDDWEVEFSNLAPSSQIVAAPAAEPTAVAAASPKVAPAKKAAAPKGTPITSPMTGIYYSASSPGAPPFVKEGEPITAGQVVALIEAMKVFNEVTAISGGMVLKLVATNGQLVQAGDTLFTIA